MHWLYFQNNELGDSILSKFAFGPCAQFHKSYINSIIIKHISVNFHALSSTINQQLGILYTISLINKFKVFFKLHSVQFGEILDVLVNYTVELVYYELIFALFS